MTKQDKIKAMREIMRDLNETNNNGELEVTLVNLKLRDLDELNYVSITHDGTMTVSGISLIDEYDWTEPVEAQADEVVDKLYDALMKHAEWMEKYGNSKD